MWCWSPKDSRKINGKYGTSGCQIPGWRDSIRANKHDFEKTGQVGPDQSSVERTQTCKMAESHGTPLSDLKASWWGLQLWQFEFTTKIEHGRTRDTSFPWTIILCVVTLDLQFLVYFLSNCSVSFKCQIHLLRQFLQTSPLHRQNEQRSFCLVTKVLGKRVLLPGTLEILKMAEFVY